MLNGNFPSDKIKARRIWEKAFNYMIINDKLYRKSNSGPLLRCLSLDEARRLMEEIHEGVCGNHLGRRSLAHIALSTGYFWPYMMSEAQKFMQKCDKCQRFAPIIHWASRTFAFCNTMAICKIGIGYCWRIVKVSRRKKVCSISNRILY